MKETGQEDQNTTEFHEEARTMSRDDVHHYEGVTLDEQGREEKMTFPLVFISGFMPMRDSHGGKKCFLWLRRQGVFSFSCQFSVFSFMGILVVALLGSALYFLRIFSPGNKLTSHSLKSPALKRAGLFVCG